MLKKIKQAFISKINMGKSLISIEATRYFMDVKRELLEIDNDFSKAKSSEKKLMIANRLLEVSRQLSILSKEMKFQADPYLRQDDFSLLNNKQVLLQKKIDAHLDNQKKLYKKHMYFSGFPYQSLEIANVFGARDTEKRYSDYELDFYLSEKDVILDIGGNIGAMSLYSVFRKGCKADCVEHNPYMTLIGKDIAEHLKISEKIMFYDVPFQEWKPNQLYTKIFSFAAHHTDDGGHSPGFKGYIKKLHSYLSQDGMLFFESHNNDVGERSFYEDMNSIATLFDVISQKKLTEWGQREFYILKKKK